MQAGWGGEMYLRGSGSGISKVKRGGPVASSHDAPMRQHPAPGGTWVLEGLRRWPCTAGQAARPLRR